MIHDTMLQPAAEKKPGPFPAPSLTRQYMDRFLDESLVDVTPMAASDCRRTALELFEKYHHELKGSEPNQELCFGKILLFLKVDLAPLLRREARPETRQEQAIRLTSFTMEDRLHAAIDMKQAMAKLEKEDPLCYQTMIMSVVLEQSRPQIEKSLNLSKQQVRTLLERGSRLLRSYLEAPKGSGGEG